jgi:glutathione S-transferase
MAIAQSGVNVQIHEVSLRDKPAAMLAASPKGTVPVLVLPGPQTPENVIAESLDIMRWALAQADPEGWLTVADTARQNDWIARNDAVFKPLLDRYKYANRHPELTPAAHREAALAGFVNALDAQLAEQAFLFGDQPALADVAIFPFIRQFAGVDRAWFDAAPLAGVQRWLAYWVEAPSFVGVMGQTG